MQIRPVTHDDIGQMVALVEARRRVYETYEPVFWKVAEHSAEMTAPWFTALAARLDATVRVAVEDGVVHGFLIALPTPVPPVYAPGGPTVTIDDFCVRTPDQWETVGRALLDEVRNVGRAAGWRQLIVVGADRDEPKAAMLRGADLRIASTWWTQPLSPAESTP